MKELALKYGCNPNQKPSRVYMTEGELPIEVLCGRPGYINLLDALNSGKIRAAGLDVFAEEPSKNSELLNHPMVSATPHIGAQTKEAQTRIGAEIVDIIENFGQ